MAVLITVIQTNTSKKPMSGARYLFPRETRIIRIVPSDTSMILAKKINAMLKNSPEVIIIHRPIEVQNQRYHHAIIPVYPLMDMRFSCKPKSSAQMQFYAACTSRGAIIPAKHLMLDIRQLKFLVVNHSSRWDNAGIDYIVKEIAKMNYRDCFS
jgi:hypothetical protein